MYPDFLGIGAQKAGTTWLYQNLRAHPGIWMPQKELHYFDRKLERGDDWYASRFVSGEGYVTGEITPAYSVLSVDRISHVHTLMPKAKIIFLMRNPIERAWSQAMMRFSKQLGESVEDMSAEEFIAFFERFSQQRLSDYLQTLENWGWFYPEERIFVGFLEDISFSPDSLLRALYSFLGLDASDAYRVIRRKIHVGVSESMPSRVAVYLAYLYRERLRYLDIRFGGYASFWSYCAESLIANPPSTEYVPYPFWKSYLWSDWLLSGERSSKTPQNIKSDVLIRFAQ